MSTIQIDDLTIRLPSDTRNTFNPTFAFGGRGNHNNSSSSNSHTSLCSVGLRDLQSGELILPMDSEGNLVVVPGRRYQVMQIVAEDSFHKSNAATSNHNGKMGNIQKQPPPHRQREAPASGEGRSSMKVVSIPLATATPDRRSLNVVKSNDNADDTVLNQAAASSVAATSPETTPETTPEGRKKRRNKKKNRSGGNSPGIVPSAAPQQSPSAQDRANAEPRHSSQNSNNDNNSINRAKGDRVEQTNMAVVGSGVSGNEPSLFDIAMGNHGGMVNSSSRSPRRNQSTEKETERENTQHTHSDVSPGGEQDKRRKESDSANAPSAKRAKREQSEKNKSVSDPTQKREVEGKEVEREETFLARFALLATPHNDDLSPPVGTTMQSHHNPDDSKNQNHSRSGSTAVKRRRPPMDSSSSDSD